MTFTESINSCFSNYANFTGRASRSEYWWFALFIFAGGFALSLFSNILSSLFFLATFLPSLSAATRRLHDTGRSGWIQLVVFIPLIGWLFLIYLLAQEGTSFNRFGMPIADSSEAAIY